MAIVDAKKLCCGTQMAAVKTQSRDMTAVLWPLGGEGAPQLV
jgi:hypothetical protein